MKTTRVMLVSFATNLFLIVFKTIFGIIGSSSALLADGMHSFSDVISDLFTQYIDGLSKSREKFIELTIKGKSFSELTKKLQEINL